MNNVIEFGTLGLRKKDIEERKLKRFNELKGREFSDILTDSEKIEYDKVYKWVKLHI